MAEQRVTVCIEALINSCIKNMQTMQGNNIK